MLTTTRYDLLLPSFLRFKVSRICWCFLTLNSLLLLYIRLDLMVLIPFLRVPRKRVSPLFLFFFILGVHPPTTSLSLSVSLSPYLLGENEKKIVYGILSPLCANGRAERMKRLRPWSDGVSETKARRVQLVPIFGFFGVGVDRGECNTYASSRDGHVHRKSL